MTSYNPNPNPNWQVGSPDVEDDIVRARAIREEIGDENFLMMDANQKWDVGEAIIKTN